MQIIQTIYLHIMLLQSPRHHYQYWLETQPILLFIFLHQTTRSVDYKDYISTYLVVEITIIIITIGYIPNQSCCLFLCIRQRDLQIIWTIYLHILSLKSPSPSSLSVLLFIISFSSSFDFCNGSNHKSRFLTLSLFLFLAQNFSYLSLDYQYQFDSNGERILVIFSIFTIQLFSAATCCRGSVRTTTPSAWRTRKTLSPPRSTSPASGSSSMIIIALVVNRPYLQAGGGDGAAQQEDPQS